MMMIVLYRVIAQTIGIPIDQTNIARRKLVEEPGITDHPHKSIDLQCYWQRSKLNPTLEEVSCYACFRS